MFLLTSIFGLPKIFIESFVKIVLIPINLNIFDAHFNLGLSFWFNSAKFLKYEIPFALAATKKRIKNSSIAPELNLSGQLILFNFEVFFISMSAIF